MLVLDTAFGNAGMELEQTDTWHRRLTALRDSPDGDAAFTVLWNMLHARVFTDADGSGYRSLSIHERTIWIANIYIGEVLNGGFHQFFSNSSGDHSDELPDVLRRVGAAKMLDLFDRARKILRKDGRVPIDRIARNKALDSIHWTRKRSYAAFDALDKVFHALADTEYPDLLQYALEHRDSIDYSLREYDTAIEHEPYLLFPEDRKASARFDSSALTVHLELEGGTHVFPLRDVDRVTIAKVQGTPGRCTLVYRFETKRGEIDVPFFARGEGARGTVSWGFEPMFRKHHLVAFKDALAEARSSAPMTPIEVWPNVPGARFVE